MRRPGWAAVVGLVIIAVGAWPVGGTRFFAVLAGAVLLATACFELAIRSVGSTDTDQAGQ